MTNKLSPAVLFSLLAIGIMAGCVGIALTWLLHTVQHLAFGYGFWGHVSFREMAEHAPPLRRFLALLGCGAVAGVGWFALHRYGAPLVDIKKAVNNPEQHMPFKTTLAHALLQILTVGMGSPLGREVAPREMSAALATRWMQRFRFDDDTRRLLLACASGAGLAAVYNVPLAATVFVLETLLLSWQPRALLAALLACGTAVLVVRLGLGDLVQYPLPEAAINPALSGWALLAGPVLALAVYAFNRSAAGLPELPRSSPKMIFTAIAAFAAIGLLAVWFPDILGNGKAGNQLSFAGAIGWHEGLALFAAKWLAVLLAMLGGAYGGRITPSMMLGGMLALTLAIAWNSGLPPVSIGAAAFIGAAVFLGLAQKMVLTAMVFMLELSRLSTAYWLPLCLCMGSALLVWTWLQAHRPD